MRLFYHPNSSASRRVVLTALHLGSLVDFVEVGNIMEPDVRKELLTRNPNGKIPVLEDGDFILWESCAIMQYLADQTEGQTVYPTHVQARADVNRWLFWNAQHWAPAIGILGWERYGKKLFAVGDPDPREIERGETEFSKFAKVLDAHLADSAWISGSSVTLADFAIAAPLMISVPASLPLSEHKNLSRWFQGVRDRIEWQKAEAGKLQ